MQINTSNSYQRPIFKIEPVQERSLLLHGNYAKRFFMFCFYFTTDVKLGRYSDNIPDSGQRQEKKLAVERTSTETEKDVGPFSL